MHLDIIYVKLNILYALRYNIEYNPMRIHAASHNLIIEKTSEQFLPLAVHPLFKLRRAVNAHYGVEFFICFWLQLQLYPPPGIGRHIRD